MTTLDRLIYMANQIARNLEALGEDAAVRGTAEHITLFWEPRMKAEIRAYTGSGLSPIAARAVQILPARSGGRGTA
jgi:formate dehydrogenase subunit delta